MIDFFAIFSSSWNWILTQINDPFFSFYLILALLIFFAILTLKKLHFEEFLKSIEMWLKSENNKLGANYFSMLCLFLILCLVGACLIVTTIMLFDLQKTNSDAITDYFSIQYQNEMQPKSESEITQIVNESKSISNISEKFEHIATWETNNFTDIYWHHVGMKSLVPYVNTYVYESNGKIRATHSFANSPYAEDPDWIQFYKFGACGEEASLFANVTNRSGFVTRFVVLDLGTWYYDMIPSKTGNHEFVEVKLADNEWYFFDPTVYGADHVLNDSPCKNGNPCENRWFGKPEQYSYFSSDQVLSVYIKDTNEDISSHYSKISVHIMNSRSPLRIGSGNRTLSLPEINPHTMFKN
jgi:hypothetical protein